MRNGIGPRAHWAYLLFALSGAGGLLFETVFLRQLSWIFGSSAVAQSLVLAAFMAGLALGASMLGRLADSSERPLRLYGLLELGAAGTGAVLVVLLGHGREVFFLPLRLIESRSLQRPLEFFFAFSLVLIPTFFMGGTLPALARYAIREMSGFTRSLGLLYGLNTIGAAAGAFVAGFYAFEYLGISRTGHAAAALLATVGVVAILLDATGSARVRRSTEAELVEPPHDDAEPGVRAAGMFAACAGGLAVLGYEVAWTRLLSLFMRSFSYSFSLMLALFLVGLALGSAVIALGASRVRRPAILLGWLQLGIGGYVASSLLWLPDRLAPVASSGFSGFLIAATGRAAIIVLPPTVLSGIALPLAARCVTRSLAKVGADLGRVYFLNTAGAITGAIVTGLVLLPALGASVALGSLACFQAASGIYVLLRAGAPRRQLAAAAVLTLLSAAPLLAGPGRFVNAFLQASLRAETIGETLFFHEGAADTVAIVREYGFRDPEAKSLITNGVAMSATVKPVWRYMALEGHLPVLFAKSPQHALAVGVGTGITLGAIASHDEPESITAIELSDGVIGGLHLFEAENGGAFLDPRVRLLNEDGRHFLELSRDRFDVITLEPPPPIVAGSVHLYTLDFYELCRRRSRPGAVVAQWLPLHAQSLASARMVARTFVEAFPHAMLWLPSVRDAVLIGSDAPLRLEARRLAAAFAARRTRDNLRQAFFETPEALLATFLLDREGIVSWAGDAPVITDERPLMEFFRHQGGNMKTPEIASLLAIPQADWDWLGGTDEGDLTENLGRENAALRSYVRAATDRDASAGALAARIARSTEFFLYPLGCTTAQLERIESGSSELPLREIEPQRRRCRMLRAEADRP
jgi:spermidine synthase